MEELEVHGRKVEFIKTHDLRRPISTTTLLPLRERVNMQHLPPDSTQPR